MLFISQIAGIFKLQFLKEKRSDKFKFLLVTTQILEPKKYNVFA